MFAKRTHFPEGAESEEQRGLAAVRLADTSISSMASGIDAADVLPVVSMSLATGTLVGQTEIRFHQGVDPGIGLMGHKDLDVLEGNT